VTLDGWKAPGAPATRARVKRSLSALTRFPRLGRELEGAWRPFHVLLGPWRWLLIAYVYEAPEDPVLVVTIQDARTSSAAASA
jgi:hypothetical protein